MWMRRIGVPALWPSRLKVSLMCVLQCGFIYSFSSYLNQADVDYLDISSPLRQQLHCGRAEPECSDASDPLACLLDRNELLFGSIWRDRAMPSACATAPASTCTTFAVPLGSIHGDLGRLHTVDRWLNPLRLWAFLFALMTSAFIGSVAIHDHALIMARCRPSIKSLRSLQHEMPLWWNLMAAVQFSASMGLLRRRCRPLWIALLPVWCLYRLAIFLGVVYPLTALAAWRRPIAMSRLMVCCTGIFCLTCALLFDLSILFLERDWYALFWNAPQLDRGCICFCEYPLSKSVVLRLVFLGVVVGAGSFSVSFRAMKGLRRANWGNLFSVLYAVPVEVFPVRWTRPEEAGGGPITFRKEGEEVQGEPAFDPFCLMDEQPESARSCARLRPEPQDQPQRARWQRLSPEAEIGCCGIPVPFQAAVKPAPDEDLTAPDVEAAEGTRPVPPAPPVDGVLLPGLPPGDVDAADAVLFEGGAEAFAHDSSSSPRTETLPPTPHPPADPASSALAPPPPPPLLAKGKSDRSMLSI